MTFCASFRELPERAGRAENLQCLRERARSGAAASSSSRASGSRSPRLGSTSRIDDEPLGIHLQDGPEARARRAGAVRRVEREEARRDLGRATCRSRGRRSSPRATRPRGRPATESDRRAPPRPASPSRASRQALAVRPRRRGFDDEAVHDDLDRVLLLLVELRRARRAPPSSRPRARAGSPP